MIAEHSYHVVGVGGVGMSALAQLLSAAGHAVSGSDRAFDRGELMDKAAILERAGIRRVPQDGSGVTASTDAVAVSTAIEPDNPELRRAVALGVATMHRAVMLARCAADAQVVAVTGTSGKSTVTAMIGWVLQELGADPTVVNGAEMPAWRAPDRLGNVRLGGGDWWVIEADESDRSLTAYTVDWAVITNVSADHFSAAEARELFGRFAVGARRGVVDMTVAGRHGATGLAPSLSVPMPGSHNQENARTAWTLCRRMGYGDAAIREALARFPGLHRRLERVGVVNGATILDDYAHNPAKIKAAWLAVAESAPAIVGVWRPHGYRPLALMLDALAAAFAEVMRPEDCLLVLPVYDAGGTADRSIDADALVSRLRSADRSVQAVSESEVPGRVRDLARPGGAVLVMGARDPGLPALAAACRCG